MGLKARMERLLEKVDQATGGTPSIVRAAFRSFGTVRASQAAAGMAYYALLSLFPLALFLVSLGSLFLRQQTAYAQVMDYLANAIPVSRSLIDRNLQQIMEQRGPVGLIGLIGSIWSASGAFAILTKNLNLAWRQSDARGFIKERLLAIGIIMILAVLVLLAAFSTTLLGLLANADLPIVGQLLNEPGPIWQIGTRLVPWVVAFALFSALYRWVPTAQVDWKWAAIGALFASIAWEAAINLFAWYVASGLARFAIVYGSLGSVVALLIWIYYGSWITLFGAHLAAAAAREHGRRTGDKKPSP